uniref:Uncharacterized protein n=1 Tax=Candidatus Kentrum sp. FM TaxID=2126340 RepID=A0A450U259_9GAMM|nr:MAG: hypothetical protein BECKFM1743A_GA0114220_109532 [Candidatus Kentron sp. FM]
MRRRREAVCPNSNYEIAERIQEAKEKWMERGMRKGEVRLKKVARALLGEGVAIDIISKSSGLSEKEIRELSID